MNPYPQSRSYPPPPPPPYAAATDPILEITNLIRALLFYYTDNIAQHNRIIDSYNSNIAATLNLLNQILDYYTTTRGRAMDYHDYYRNSVGLGARRRSSSFDLSNLVYLLNIPLQNAAAAAADRTPAATLTQTQIANATRMITYDESMGERRCPISLDDFAPNEQICQIRGCNHIFKTAHLMRWFESHIDCPVCRYDLRRYRAAAAAPVQAPPETESSPMEDISPAPAPTSTATNMRRNVSVSEFLPILENILSPPAATTTRRPQTTFEDALPTLSSATTNMLSSRFSQILSDIILEQMPTLDASNNLLYTIEIPLSR